MKFEATFETNVGRITATWNGGHEAKVYHGNSDRPTTTLDMWNPETEEPLITASAKAFGDYVREWLWEMERGIEFDRIVVLTIEELEETSGRR